MSTLSPSTRTGDAPAPSFRDQRRSRIDEFEGLAQALTQWALHAGVPPRAMHSVVLILDELFSNIVIHGYRGDPEGDILVEAEVQSGSLAVTLTDHAFPFNPLLVPETDTTLPLEERPVGGLGLLFVRRTADALAYRLVGEGTPQAANQLRFTKRFEPATSD